MSQFRYVGGAPAQVMPNYVFQSFGQLVEMPDDLAEHAILNRVHLVPIDLFSTYFSPEELRKYSRFESHEFAPQGFIDKRTKIWQEAQSLHSAVKSGMSAAAPLDQDRGGE